MGNQNHQKTFRLSPVFPSVPGFSAIPNRQTCCDYPLEAARRRPTLNTRAVRTYQTAALVSTATEYRQPVLRDYASDQNTGKKHYQSWKKQNSGEGMNICQTST